MGVHRLDHYNIVTEKLDETVAFYVSVLGLEDGKRPTFQFPGAWLYSGASPLVHLMQLGEDRGQGTGPIDHIAFEASDYDGFTQHLKNHGVTYDERFIEDANLRQVFLLDPNGVKVEINFPQ